MSRLTDKLKQAGGVVARQTAKIEARADAIIAQEATIEQQTQSAFAPHEALLSQTEQDLHDLQAALATVSNAPPLDVSGTGDPSTTSSPSTPPVNPGGSRTIVSKDGKVLGG